MEHFFIKLLISIFAPHGEEDVASDELMNNLAISWQTTEDDIALVIKLDHHVLGFPVDIPSLEETEI